jgi:hypothetical protein
MVLIIVFEKGREILRPTAELQGRSFLAIRSCDDDMILDGKLDQLGC